MPEYLVWREVSESIQVTADNEDEAQEIANEETIGEWDREVMDQGVDPLPAIIIHEPVTPPHREWS